MEVFEIRLIKLGAAIIFSLYLWYESLEVVEFTVVVTAGRLMKMNYTLK